MAEGSRLTGTHRRVYAAINSSSTPFWLAMVVAPRTRATRALLDRAPALQAGIGVAYGALLSRGLVRSGRPLNFLDPDGVRDGLAVPETFLAAWSHYIAFDLFVGRWIWQDALEHDRDAPFELVLTWLAGPVGLSLYLLRHRRA